MCKIDLLFIVSMHNISTECLFSLITNPPVDIHRNSAGNPPEIRRKSTGIPPEIHRNERPESFKFWTQALFRHFHSKKNKSTPPLNFESVQN